MRNAPNKERPFGGNAILVDSVSVEAVTAMYYDKCGQLAAAIVSTANALAGTSATRLTDLFRDPRAQALAIAEINSAGNLHAHRRISPFRDRLSQD